MNYKIALVNVFWSEEENNTPYFESANWQNIYFDSLASGKTSPLVNYNMGNNIETTIVFRDTTERPIDEVVKSNYAIVYTMDGDNIVNRRYFFAYPRQDSGRQMIVRLSLDDVQTNYVQYQGQYTNDVLINRACLNRFKLREGSQNVVDFDLGNEQSPFYTRENISPKPKRLTKRRSLNFQIDERTEGSSFNTFFNNNIIGWEYVYLACKSEEEIDYQSLIMRPSDYDAKWVIGSAPILSNFYGTENNEHGLKVTNGNKCKGAVVCLCAPVYNDNSLYGRNNVLRFVGGNYQISLSTYGLEEFLKMNDDYVRVYARKFSMRPPFRSELLTEGSEYSYDSEHNRLDVTGTLNEIPIGTNQYGSIEKLGVKALYTGTITHPTSNEVFRQGCLFVTEDYDGRSPYETATYGVTKRTNFTLSEIVNAPKKNYNFNPKLLGQDFFELHLTNFSQSFTYDFSKIFSNTIKFLYNEALTPDITKGYARLKAPTGLYVADNNINLNGLVISNDYSLMVANDQLKQFLANNKNFFLQQALNIGQKTIAGALAGGFAQGGYGAVAGATSGLMSIPNIAMQLDNMRSAPDQLRNGNGNVYFASDIQPFKLAIEEYDVTEYDKEAFNDYCHMFGFAYGKMGKLADFVNIRANFNYIEADLINIPIRISNVEKERLKAKFNRGIRFWNNDLVDFSAENYENWVYQKYREVNNNE